MPRSLNDNEARLLAYLAAGIPTSEDSTVPFNFLSLAPSAWPRRPRITFQTDCSTGRCGAVEGYLTQAGG